MGGWPPGTNLQIQCLRRCERLPLVELGSMLVHGATAQRAVGSF